MATTQSSEPDVMRIAEEIAKRHQQRLHSNNSMPIHKESTLPARALLSRPANLDTVHISSNSNNNNNSSSSNKLLQVHSPSAASTSIDIESPLSPEYRRSRERYHSMLYNAMLAEQEQRQREEEDYNNQVSAKVAAAASASASCSSPVYGPSVVVQYEQFFDLNANCSSMTPLGLECNNSASSFTEATAQQLQDPACVDTASSSSCPTTAVPSPRSQQKQKAAVLTTNNNNNTNVNDNHNHNSTTVSVTREGSTASVAAVDCTPRHQTISSKINHTSSLQHTNSSLGMTVSTRKDSMARSSTTMDTTTAAALQSQCTPTITAPAGGSRSHQKSAAAAACTQPTTALGVAMQQLIRSIQSKGPADPAKEMVAATTTEVSAVVERRGAAGNKRNAADHSLMAQPRAADIATPQRPAVFSKDESPPSSRPQPSANKNLVCLKKLADAPAASGDNTNNNNNNSSDYRPPSPSRCLQDSLAADAQNTPVKKSTAQKLSKGNSKRSAATGATLHNHHQAEPHVDRSRQIMSLLASHTTDSSSSGKKYTVCVEGHYQRVSHISSSSTWAVGSVVLYEGDRGIDAGRVVTCSVAEAMPLPLAPPGKRGSTPLVLRAATKEEQYTWLEAQVSDANEALPVIEEAVKSLGLPLRIYGAAYQFDKEKLTVLYQSSEQRVDFRQLLQALFSRFRCRIWMERAKDAADEEGNSIEVKN